MKRRFSDLDADLRIHVRKRIEDDLRYVPRWRIETGITNTTEWIQKQKDEG